MFQINNNLKLNITHFIILLIIILSLFLLYNKLYINSYYLPVVKYKSMSRKYKQVILQYQNKLDEVQQQLEQLQQMQRPISMPSNPPLRTNDIPPKEHFQQNNVYEEVKSSSNGTCYYEPVPENKKNNDMSHLMDGSLSSSIDKLLNDQRNNQISSEINGFDTVWRGTSYSNL